MLVLSRKKKEGVVIDGDVTIVVLEIDGDKVKLGIEAPRDKAVHRHEVYEGIYGHPHPRMAEIWATLGKPKPPRPRQSSRRRQRR